MTTNHHPSTNLEINFPDLLVRVENDHELLCELFSIFKVDFPRQLHRLRSAVTNGDPALVASVSHTLKGMLMNLAAEKPAAAAARLEQLARSREVSSLPTAFADFEELATAVLPAMDTYLAGVRS